MNSGFKLVVTVAACILTLRVNAQIAPVDPSSLCPPCLHDQVLQGLPASVEAIIAVNNAATQRTSPAGQALAEAVFASGAWSESTRAWAELSRTLDWTPSRTFDELLGRRISLVVRGVSAAEGPEWVIVTAVSEPTQRRLRDRLRAAPRSAVAGLSVLSIEDGSFQLLVAPSPIVDAKGDQGSVVLLAPRRSERLLDEVAPTLTMRSVSLPASSERSCDVVIAVRPAGSSERTLSVTATSSSMGWDATVVCDPSLVLGAGKSVSGVPAWRDSLFKELEPGSLLAVMSLAGMDDMPFLPEGVAAWKRLLADLTRGEAGEQAGLRTGVFIRAVGPGPERASAGGQALNSAALKQPLGSSPSPPRGRLAFSLVSESRDPRTTLVKGDMAMTRLARMIMTGESEEVGNRIRFEVPSTGPRTLVVGDSLPVHPTIEPSLSRAFGVEPILTWDLVDRRDGAAWWVASLAPMHNALTREQRALALPETGEARRRLSIGCVRPSALERWAEAVEPGLLGSIAGAASFDSIRWDAWVRDDGRIGASINIRMTPASDR